jgi:surfactin synthase thioesterase subunit
MLLISCLIGFSLGIISTYSFSQRTSDIICGKPINVFVLSGVISTSAWLSMKYVVAHDLAGFAGFSLGGAVAATAMAYLNKLYLNKNKAELRKTG